MTGTHRHILADHDETADWQRGFREGRDAYLAKLRAAHLENEQLRHQLAKARLEGGSERAGRETR